MSEELPGSTYRLQVTADFTLYDAAAVTGYLRALGVDAVYLSPILQSTSGSTHGYDTVDPSRIDTDRGGPEGWSTLLAATAEAGLEVVVDIVPNHLGIAVPIENPAWWDVLRLGRSSRYADWFDIDWSRPRILVPTLGDDAELRVESGELRYADHRFPLAPGTWQEGDDADAVHARQHYELVHYSRGDAELNYRRFFSITTLAGVRVEDPEVFAATHALISEWVARGEVAGLRIDHPDGLTDPLGYLRRLRALAPAQWIVVEKILEPGEQLPVTWPVEGTTGYDAMREVNGVFSDPAAEAETTALYEELTGDPTPYSEHVTTGKRIAVGELLAAEVRRIVALAPDVPDADAAIRELAVAFPVYRSYLPEGEAELDRALATVAARAPELDEALAALSPRLRDPEDELALRFQQLTGATMAKGVEDTAYYRYARFLALNEVGGDPAHLGIDVAQFHLLQTVRQRIQPRSMTSLSTHDTKRGEDVRARLAVLAEQPTEWAAFARRYVAGSTSGRPSFDYLLAQILAGTGPVDRSRIRAYAEKAMRESRQVSSWSAVDQGYEEAVLAAVDGAYDDPATWAAWSELDAVLTPYGWSNALGQKLVQLTMPGVPDVYQGTELWDDSLVDPDNRRAVDFTARAAMLAALEGPPTVDATGAAKLWVTSRALRLRRSRPELFSTYEPVDAEGPAARHAIAFDRGGAVTVATRLPLGLAARGGWEDTTLALQGSWTDQLTGRTTAGAVRLADLLDQYPVALLVR